MVKQGLDVYPRYLKQNKNRGSYARSAEFDWSVTVERPRFYGTTRENGFGSFLDLLREALKNAARNFWKGVRGIETKILMAIFEEKWEIEKLG